MGTRFWRDRAIQAGFLGLRASGLHRMGGRARGLGAVLMFHHVRPRGGETLRMNRGLEIDPGFLSTVVETLSDLGFDLVSLDDAVASIKDGERARPFAAITFDDGYRDNLDFAAPILRQHGAPFAIYATSGFVGGTVRAWWEDLEAAIRRLPRVKMRLGAEVFDLPAETRAQKEAAADLLAPKLRTCPQAEAQAAVADLLAEAGAEAASGHENLFMNWDALRQLAQDPLCTIGVHTLTHPSLARLDRVTASRELEESRRIIEEKIGRPARHLAFPYGQADAAATREFELARELGFASAVTTRPGMIFGEHAAHLTALPRLSVNGIWQSRGALEALLSGLPFALWNRGRRLNVA
ncbi:MAG TPA: polysaccharide deacetylase family protein [Beijerinckiaceae bacterium]|nr:polysaccharide deacetylase family protein [Beijerinckiaceae bacterium]